MCGFEPRWEYVFTAAEALTVMHTLRTGEMRVQVLPAALGALVDESRRAVGLDYSSQGHGLVGGLRQTQASLFAFVAQWKSGCLVSSSSGVRFFAEALRTTVIGGPAVRQRGLPGPWLLSLVHEVTVVMLD